MSSADKMSPRFLTVPGAPAKVALNTAQVAPS